MRIIKKLSGCSIIYEPIFAIQSSLDVASTLTFLQ